MKGYDNSLNLVIDECIEYTRDESNSYSLSGAIRNLGLMICRGSTVTVISPTAGEQEIQNPFIQQQKAEI